MNKEPLPCLHKDTYFFGYGIDIEKPIDMANKIIELQEKNQQLKDNWDELKEYISIEWYCYDNESTEFEVAKDILNRIQALESGDSDE